MEVMKVMEGSRDVTDAARPLAYITFIPYITSTTNCVARTSVYLNLYCLLARQAL